MIEFELNVVEKMSDVGIDVSSDVCYTDSAISSMRMPDIRNVKYYGRMELIKSNIKTAANQISCLFVMFRKSIVDRFSIRIRADKECAWKQIFTLRAKLSGFKICENVQLIC